MAFDAATILEMRDTGSSTNGGIFADLDPGTSVDYSQQDSAQLSVSDIATDGAGTGVSSATGGFTGAMAGNGIYIGGGAGLTAGFYQITVVTDTNNITIDQSAGASGSGGTGNVGGAWKPGNSLDDEMYDNIEDGMTVYIKKGDYASSENATFSFGDEEARVLIAGYNVTRGDNPTGTDRPTYQLSHALTLGSFYDIRNIRFDSALNYLRSGNYCSVARCKFFASSGTYGGTYLSLTTRSRAMECEFIGTTTMNSSNVMLNAGDVSVTSCYFYSGGPTKGTAISTNNGALSVTHCIFDNVASGVRDTGFGDVYTSFCVFYECGTGVDMDYYYHHGIVSCIFEGCTTGVLCDVAGGASMTYKCCFYNNTTDMSNGVLDDSDLEADPQMTDPDNQDFTLDSASPCVGGAASIKDFEVF